MTERKPVKGEVWRHCGNKWQCVDDEADSRGQYGWLLAGGIKTYDDTVGLTPPRPAATTGWRTVCERIGVFACETAEMAHDVAKGYPDYLGALNLETGEWVPRP